MEQIDHFYFNDMLAYSDKTVEILEEFRWYLTARCYSAIILFDGLNVDKKVEIEKNIYTWKIQINETLYIKVVMKMVDKSQNLLIEVEWEVWSMPDENKSQLYYLYKFIRNECETLDIFFHVRK